MSVATQNVSRSRRTRSIVGVLVAPPAIGATAGLIAFLILALLNTREFDVRILGVAGTAILWGAMLGAIIGWPVAFLLGLAAHKVLQKRNWSKPGHYFAAGAVLGAIPTPLLAIYVWATSYDTGGSSDIAVAAPFFLVLIVAAAFSGFVFWFIRRPDLDAKTPEPAR